MRVIVSTNLLGKCQVTEPPSFFFVTSFFNCLQYYMPYRAAAATGVSDTAALD
jgi:hypothetical protein